MNWLVRFTALGLEPREREIVLGDLVECRLSGSRSFFEVLGLVARRQVRIWTNWRPWFALVGVVGISGVYLSLLLAGLRGGILEQILAWRRYGVHYNVGVTSFRDDVVQMCCLAAAIFCWTTVSASVLRRLSGRALWLTGLLLYFVVDNSRAWAILSGAAVVRGNHPWWSFLTPALLPDPAVLLFFVLPAICGVCRTLPGIVPLTIVGTIAAVLLGEYHAHDLERLSGGAFRPAPWPAIIAPYLLVSWPLLLVRSDRYGGVSFPQASRHYQ